jgi:hypothetical protein
MASGYRSVDRLPTNGGPFRVDAPEVHTHLLTEDLKNGFPKATTRFLVARTKGARRRRAKSIIIASVKRLLRNNFMPQKPEDYRYTSYLIGNMFRWNEGRIRDWMSVNVSLRHDFFKSAAGVQWQSHLSTQFVISSFWQPLPQQHPRAFLPIPFLPLAYSFNQNHGTYHGKLLLPVRISRNVPANAILHPVTSRHSRHFSRLRLSPLSTYCCIDGTQEGYYYPTHSMQ